jgi:hypothetical protein
MIVRKMIEKLLHREHDFVVRKGVRAEPPPSKVV